MSTAIRSAVNRRVNNIQPSQLQTEVPQNRVIPRVQSVGFQQGTPNVDNVSQFNRQNDSSLQRPNMPMSVQQSFDLVFNRLTNLDKTVVQLQKNTTGDGNIMSVDDNTLNSIVEEFNSRTEILAGEISELKDMLIKLQTYTLEVNQKMFIQLNQPYSVVNDVVFTEDIGEDTANFVSE